MSVVINYLDCGCGILGDGTRNLCPSCASEIGKDAGNEKEKYLSLKVYEALQPYRDFLANMDIERDEAERKAIDSLARYKFEMFGYWASSWVHINKMCQTQKPNPFKRLVKEAKSIKKEKVEEWHKN